METAFTPLASFAGGALIGLSAVICMLAFGRIAGISGLMGRLLPPNSTASAQGWPISFLVGVIIAPLTYLAFGGFDELDISITMPPALFIIGGLLVGFGSVLGNGCTSGHGVCGISRFSSRSIIATLTFMATAFLTVLILRHGFGV